MTGCRHCQGFTFVRIESEEGLPGHWECNICDYYLNFNPDYAGRIRDKNKVLPPMRCLHKGEIVWLCYDDWRLHVVAMLAAPRTGTIPAPKLSTGGKY